MSNKGLNELQLTTEEKKLSQKIIDDIASKADGVKNPLFRKAASVINNLTGFVEVTILVPKIDRDSGQSEYISLFNIPYNNITFFEISSPGGSVAGAEFTLNVSDSTYKFVRIIYARLYQLALGKKQISAQALPQIRITFGYPQGSEEKYQKTSNYAQPVLRQTVDGTISSIDTTVTMSKEEHIIKGTTSSAINSTIGNSEFKPYNAYGENILEFLNVHELLEKFYTQYYIKEISDVLKKTKDRRNKEKTFGTLLNNIQSDKDIEAFFDSINQAKKNKTVTYEFLESYRPKEIKDFIKKNKNAESLVSELFTYIKERRVKTQSALVFLLKAYLDQKKEYYEGKNKKVKTVIINLTSGFRIKEEEFPAKEILAKQTKTWEDLFKEIGSRCSLSLALASGDKANINKDTLNLSKIDFEFRTYYNEPSQKTEMKSIVNTLTAIVENSYDPKDPNDKKEETTVLNEIKGMLTNEDQTQFDFIIIKPKSDFSFINLVTGLNKKPILNVYTIFPKKFTTPGKSQDYFNSGSKSLQESSFPDVISFSPLVNYQSVISSIVTASLSTVDGQSGSTQLTDETKNKNLNDSIKMNLLNESPVVVNPNSGINSSSLLKKEKEILFNKAMYSKVSKINATLEIFGEPALTTFILTGRYILVKYYEASGELSPFSGFYSVDRVIHKISNNKFTTTLSITKAVTFGFDQIEGLNNLSGQTNNVLVEKPASENQTSAGKASTTPKNK